MYSRNLLTPSKWIMYAFSSFHSEKIVGKVGFFEPLNQVVCEYSFSFTGETLKYVE
jgi:hypothetical protein